MTQILVNNASSELTVEATAIATTLTVLDGTSFPDPTAPGNGNASYLITLAEFDQSTQAEVAWEIMRVTGVAGNVITVERAQEGTVARIWEVETSVQARLTADTLSTTALQRIEGAGGATQRIEFTIAPSGGDFTSYQEAFAYLEAHPLIGQASDGDPHYVRLEATGAVAGGTAILTGIPYLLELFGTVETSTPCEFRFMSCANLRFERFNNPAAEVYFEDTVAVLNWSYYGQCYFDYINCLTGSNIYMGNDCTVGGLWCAENSHFHIGTATLNIVAPGSSSSIYVEQGSTLTGADIYIDQTGSAGNYAGTLTATWGGKIDIDKLTILNNDVGNKIYRCDRDSQLTVKEESFTNVPTNKINEQYAAGMGENRWLDNSLLTIGRQTTLDRSFTVSTGAELHAAWDWIEANNPRSCEIIQTAHITLTKDIDVYGFWYEDSYNCHVMWRGLDGISYDIDLAGNYIAMGCRVHLDMGDLEFGNGDLYGYHQSRWTMNQYVSWNLGVSIFLYDNCRWYGPSVRCQRLQMNEQSHMESFFITIDYAAKTTTPSGLLRLDDNSSIDCNTLTIRNTGGVAPASPQALITMNENTMLRVSDRVQLADTELNYADYTRYDLSQSARVEIGDHLGSVGNLQQQGTPIRVLPTTGAVVEADNNTYTVATWAQLLIAWDTIYANNPANATIIQTADIVMAGDLDNYDYDGIKSHTKILWKSDAAGSGTNQAWILDGNSQTTTLKVHGSMELNFMDIDPEGLYYVCKDSSKTVWYESCSWKPNKFNGVEAYDNSRFEAIGNDCYMETMYIYQNANVWMYTLVIDMAAKSYYSFIDIGESAELHCYSLLFLSTGAVNPPAYSTRLITMSGSGKMVVTYGITADTAIIDHPNYTVFELQDNALIETGASSGYGATQTIGNSIKSLDGAETIAIQYIEDHPDVTPNGTAGRHDLVAPTYMDAVDIIMALPETGNNKMTLHITATDSVVVGDAITGDFTLRNINQYRIVFEGLNLSTNSVGLYIKDCSNIDFGGDLGSGAATNVEWLIDRSQVSFGMESNVTMASESVTPLTARGPYLKLNDGSVVTSETSLWFEGMEVYGSEINGASGTLHFTGGGGGTWVTADYAGVIYSTNNIDFWNYVDIYMYGGGTFNAKWGVTMANPTPDDANLEVNGGDSGIYANDFDIAGTLTTNIPINAPDTTKGEVIRIGDRPNQQTGLIENHPNVVPNGTAGLLTLTAATPMAALAILQANQATNVEGCEVEVFCTSADVAPAVGTWWEIRGLNAYYTIFKQLNFVTNSISLSVKDCSNVEFWGTMPDDTGQIEIWRSNVHFGTQVECTWAGYASPTTVSGTYMSLYEQSRVHCSSHVCLDGLQIYDNSQVLIGGDLLVTDGYVTAQKMSELYINSSIDDYSGGLFVTCDHQSKIHANRYETKTGGDIDLIANQGSKITGVGTTFSGGAGVLTTSVPVNQWEMDDGGAGVFFSGDPDRTHREFHCATGAQVQSAFAWIEANNPESVKIILTNHITLTADIGGFSGTYDSYATHITITSGLNEYWTFNGGGFTMTIIDEMRLDMGQGDKMNINIVGTENAQFRINHETSWYDQTTIALSGTSSWIGGQEPGSSTYWQGLLLEDNATMTIPGRVYMRTFGASVNNYTPFVVRDNARLICSGITMTTDLATNPVSPAVIMSVLDNATVLCDGTILCSDASFNQANWTTFSVTENASIITTGDIIENASVTMGTEPVAQGSGWIVKAVHTPAVPASATAAGVEGTVAYDASYIYVCTSTDVWRRVAVVGGW